MKLSVKLISGLAAGFALLSGNTTSFAGEPITIEDASSYMIGVEEEVALARSAGPIEVSADATILVMGADGNYTAAVEGSNGWTCFSGRSWAGPATYQDGKRVWTQDAFNPKLRAPQCFNASAASSVLAFHRLTTRMFMQGANTDAVDHAVGQALASGEIQPPAVGAMSYMFSPNQYLNERVGRFMPHVMLYTPFVTQDSYGTPDRAMTMPIVVESGTVFATTVLMSPLWSDGSPAR